MTGEKLPFDEMFELLPVGAAVFDREMRYLTANRLWLSAHGFNDDRAVLGRTFYEALPELPEEWRDIHRRCLAGSTEYRDVDTYVGADGQTEYVRWQVSPWRDPQGQIGGVVVYAHNMGAEMAIRRRLQERECLIHDLFEKSPVGLNLCRMDGLWVESNPAFLRIIGYTSEEADGGLTYWQLTPRKYDAEEAVQLQRLRTERRYGPYEKEFIRKDGTLVPVRLHGFVVEREGEPFIWSLIEDMTHQRDLEANLEEERLKAIQASKLATVGEMAAGVAHELNNPLGVIEAYAFALEKAIERGDGAKSAVALAGIRDAGARAAKIVQGLRRFARQKDDPEDVSVASLVDAAVGLTGPRIRAAGVETSIDIRTKASVRGHAIELSQVLVNLLNNAFDAAQGADPAWIRVIAEDESDGATVSIAVENSGPPIAEPIAREIFRAFFTTKKVGEGTGLGLSISRSIAERHAGTVTLDAGAPHTRFIVRLPQVIP